MSLFLKIETASRLLGSKSPNDVAYVALDHIYMIKNIGGEAGCEIYTPSGKHTTEVSAKELLENNIVDLSTFAGSLD